MEYFGTDLKSAGHYRWNIDNGTMSKMYCHFLSGLPFHPEQLTENLPKGEVIFYQGGGFTVIGISGSCSDQRGGTKSIFWVEEIISKHQMIKRINENNVAYTIIHSMPFIINWGE